MQAYRLPSEANFHPAAGSLTAVSSSETGRTAAWLRSVAVSSQNPALSRPWKSRGWSSPCCCSRNSSCWRHGDDDGDGASCGGDGASPCVPSLLPSVPWRAFRSWSPAFRCCSALQRLVHPVSSGSPWNLAHSCRPHRLRFHWFRSVKFRCLLQAASGSAMGRCPEQRRTMRRTAKSQCSQPRARVV